MKKLILSVTALAACSVGTYAQGVITFAGNNNSNTSPTATSGGEVFINGVLDTATDINAELLYSSTINGTYSPIVTLLLSSSASASTPALGQISGAAADITTGKNGTLIDPSGNSYQIPNLASGTAVYFEVEGWTGTGVNSLPSPSATEAVGVTAPFSEVLSGALPPLANINNMPALNLTTAVPEPSTLAMAGVGLASMLIFRRRNK
jgi:hypothetical protein